MKNAYLQEEFEYFKAQYPNQKEYLQVIEEILHSVDEIVEDSSEFQENNMIKRLLEPEQVLRFKVTWLDDNNVPRVNIGYRVQHNSLLGPYKGGLRFHPSVSESVFKFLALEQTMKNALTGKDMGGGKGGSDFNPKGKSDAEVMSFCQAFMRELYHHIGEYFDIPAGDIGVGEREIGYMYGYYKSITKRTTSSMTGKPPLLGGSQFRKEATGYGIGYMVKYVLKHMKDSEIDGKRFLVSGSGNVAIYTTEKIHDLGGTVVAMSDSDGFIYCEKGIKINTIKQIKEEQRGRIKEYLEYHEDAIYEEDPREMWRKEADIALPCATQNELDEKAVEYLIDQDVLMIVEGANMATTKKGIERIKKNNVLFVPSKAANAGGVIVSGYEIAQNKQFEKWSKEEIDEKLQIDMKEIFEQIYQIAKENNRETDLQFGANVYAFQRLAKAMTKSGVV